MLQVKDGTPLYPNTSATELPRYSSSGLPPAAQPAATLSQPAVPNGGRHSSNNCLRPGCDFFGTPEYGGYCSKCFMNITKEDAGLGQRNMSVGELIFTHHCFQVFIISELITLLSTNLDSATEFHLQVKLTGFLI